MRGFLFLFLVACTRKQATVDASTTTIASTVTASATTSSAPIVDAAPIEASIDAGVRVIDTPAWPTPATDLKITWAVYPEIQDKQTGDPKRKLELVVRIGAVARRVDLGQQTGMLFFYNQSVCHSTAYPLEKDQISKITFYLGGAGGYFVKKVGDDLDVYSWSQSDGACPDEKGGLTACPVYEHIVVRIPIPSGVKISERIVEITNPTTQADMTCPPM